MTDIRKQIKGLRESISKYNLPDKYSWVIDERLEAADTMEKMLAVVEAAKKTLPYTNGHYGYREELVTALAALEQE